MDTKICPKCRLDLPVDKFGPNKRRRDGLQGACRECMKQYRKDHYHNNKTPYLDRAKAQKASIKAILKDLKEKDPCADCGVRYPYYVMHYDHLGLEEKILEISRLRQQGNLAKLLREIEKCELVCSNCHAERTYRRSVGV